MLALNNTVPKRLFASCAPVATRGLTSSVHQCQMPNADHVLLPSSLLRYSLLSAGLCRHSFRVQNIAQVLSFLCLSNSAVPKENMLCVGLAMHSGILSRSPCLQHTSSEDLEVAIKERIRDCTKYLIPYRSSRIQRSTPP